MRMTFNAGGSYAKIENVDYIQWYCKHTHCLGKLLKIPWMKALSLALIGFSLGFNLLWRSFSTQKS